MLCGVALHDELAELRTEVGPQVFDDPVAFRAAFDDFIPEGLASTGEVSLLVGAIATGAMRRLREQLALGADPDKAIEMQGDLLARDRGTNESSGARWAVSVLAHATGAIPVDQVLTRPAAGSDAELHTTVPPAPGVEATLPVSEERPPPSSPPEEQPQRAGRRANPLLIGAAVVLTLVAVTALVLLFLRDGDSTDDKTEDRTDASDAADPTGSAGEEVLAGLDITESGKTMRVQLVHDGSDTELVLLMQREGEFTEVDRQPTTCPYLESSYEAGIEHAGDLELFWGWSNLDQEGYGEYGKIVIEIERLEIYGGLEEGAVCPTD